jgi:hypothetical protein
MICTRLEGGLGNQLFQYAAGRALALRCGTGVLLDIRAFACRTRRYTPRAFELQTWLVQARVAPAGELPALLFAKRLPWMSRLVTGWRTYVERGFGYNAAFSDLLDGTYLVGYWQSPRYFGDCAATIAAEVEPVHPLSAISTAIADQIDATASVAVHVRRGDYVSLPSAATMHGALPLSYYRAAIEHVRAQVTKPRFYVFSDDPDWCRAQLPLGVDETIFVDHNRGDDAWEDMVLMSRCRHHVIANSSFSWWGAWLADQRLRDTQRQVIAPARWFAGQTDGIGDRFPAHWSVLS